MAIHTCASEATLTSVVLLLVRVVLLQPATPRLLLEHEVGALRILGAQCTAGGKRLDSIHGLDVLVPRKAKEVLRSLHLTGCHPGAGEEALQWHTGQHTGIQVNILVEWSTHTAIQVYSYCRE